MVAPNYEKGELPPFLLPVVTKANRLRLGSEDGAMAATSPLETCCWTTRMSVHRGKSEVLEPPSERRD